MKYRKFKDLNFQFSRYENGNMKGELYSGNQLLYVVTVPGWETGLDPVTDPVLFIADGPRAKEMMNLLFADKKILLAAPKQDDRGLVWICMFGNPDENREVRDRTSVADAYVGQQACSYGRKGGACYA